MLTEIKKYILAHKRVTLNDLALHFNVEPSAMEKMLEIWIAKGKIIKHTVGSDGNVCNGCVEFSQCNQSKMIYYTASA